MERSSSSGHSLRSGSLSERHIVFLVLAAAAPLGAMVGSLPFAVALGNGGGVPGTYVIAALILACFGAGYAAMSVRTRNTGAFYSYISTGLGRPLGAAAAYVAVIAYNAVAIGVVIVLGVFAQGIVADIFGFEWQWYVWALIFIPVVGIMGHRKIDVAAKVLGVALTIEIVILTIMNFGVLFDRGFDLSAFAPSNVFDGGPSFGVALLFCFLSFIGFEGTAIYAEEAKDPRVTVPRATYMAIAVIGGFYAFTTLAVVSFYGVDNALQAGLDDPTGFIFAVNEAVTGPFLTDLMEIFLITSLLASYLGIHNSAARYNFSVGRSGLLPAHLGKVHSTHGSPWAGSLLSAVLAAVVVVVTALGGGDPYLRVGAIVLALGTIGVIALQCVTSAAVVAYFSRARMAGEQDLNPITSLILPAVGAVLLAVATYLGIDNFDLLTGVVSGWQNQLPWLLVVTAIAGVGFALFLRRSNPAMYEAIGKSVDSDLDDSSDPRDKEPAAAAS